MKEKDTEVNGHLSEDKTNGEHLQYSQVQKGQQEKLANEQDIDDHIVKSAASPLNKSADSPLNKYDNSPLIKSVNPPLIKSADSSPQRLKNGMKCRVLMLDGTELLVEIEKSAKCEELVRRIADHLNLTEKEYFSCNYVDKKTKIWLNHEKKVLDQLRGKPWEVSYQVKFYPPNPYEMNDEVARYLLYLQVRSDILTGRLPSSFLTEALLGSYVIQSELGDHDPAEHGEGSEYVNRVRLSMNQTEELNDKIFQLHLQRRGLQPAECEMKYLKNAKNLALYGVHMHSAKDKEGVSILVGVNAGGLTIYKDKLRITRCQWPKILKIYYQRSNFYIKYRPEEVDQPEKTIGLRCPTYKQAKRLYVLTVEHHAFFRLKQTNLPKRNSFPVFGNLFWHPGISSLSLWRLTGSKPSSIMDSSNQSLATMGSMSLNNLEQTTPYSTYKPDGTLNGWKELERFSPQTDRYGFNPVQLRNENSLKKAPPVGEAPVAQMEDDVIDSAQVYVPKHSDERKPKNGQRGLIDDFNLFGSFCFVENVKPVVTEPERHTLVRYKSDKLVELQETSSCVPEETSTFLNEIELEKNENSQKNCLTEEDDSTDYDKALLDAIRSVTDLNFDLCVQKIELECKEEDSVHTINCD